MSPDILLPLLLPLPHLRVTVAPVALLALLMGTVAVAVAVAALVAVLALATVLVVEH